MYITDNGYGDYGEQLADLDREIDCVPEGPNSFFESLAVQMRHRNINHWTLRSLVVRVCKRSPKNFYKFVTSSQYLFTPALNEMECKEVWFPEFWYLFVVIIGRLLRLGKIVVIRDSLPPVVYPQDGRPIDKHSLVIVQYDEHGQQYHATKPISTERKFRIFLLSVRNPVKQNLA